MECANTAKRPVCHTTVPTGGQRGAQEGEKRGNAETRAMCESLLGTLLLG